MSDKPDVSAHWSKDFVEHLRTVHFSLAILCLGLIIVTSTQGDSVAKRAKTQLDQISFVVSKLHEGWFNDYCKSQIATWHPSALTVPQDAKPFDVRKDHMIRVFRKNDESGALFRFVGGCVWLLEVMPDTPENRKLGAHSFSQTEVCRIVGPTAIGESLHTVDDFVKMWDFLNRNLFIVIPTSLKKSLQPAADAGQQEILSWEFVPTPEHPINRYVDYGYARIGYGSGKEVEGFAVGYHTPADRWILDIATSDQIPLQGLSYVAGLFPAGAPRRKDTFARSFPELDEVTQIHRQDSFDQWYDSLRKELARSTETFEAFGLKVPAPQTTLWGTLLIVGVQLYLLIHLLELSKKLRANDPGWEVAWIGIYHGRVAPFLFAGSAFLLPVVAVIVLGYKAITTAGDVRERFIGWIVLATGVTASVLIALVTTRNLPNASARA